MTVSAYRLVTGDDVETKPGEDEFAKVPLYLRDAIKQVLYFTKSPVIIAFKVAGNTLSAADKPQGQKAGLLPLPLGDRDKAALHDAQLVHAVLIVGYDDSERVFKFKNSHGAGWGDNGFGYMPYDYLEYADDSYVIFDQGYTPYDDGHATQPDTGSTGTYTSSLADQLPPEWTKYFYINGGCAAKLNRSDSDDSATSTTSLKV